MSGVLLFTSCLVVTHVFLYLLQQFTQDAKEPPMVESRFPFISPLIGMRKQTRFYTDTHDKYQPPIYTLRLPGTRIYVVNSIKLISAVQHQVRTLDFAPVEVRAAVNVMGATSLGKEILNTDRNGLGQHSYSIEFDTAIRPTLSPGSHLDAVNRHAVQKISQFLDELASETPKTMKMFDWVRGKVTLATSEAVYGVQNPFRDPKILEAFWRFEPGIVILLLQFLPTILAKHSLQAREKVVEAFMDYFRRNYHEKGSALIQARYQHSIDYGVALEDIARFELGGAVAILTNTIPVAFWALWHVVSDAAALEECRRQLDHLCKVDDGSIAIDISEVHHSCPILVSTLQEVLRFHGMGTSVRIVQEDHLLNGEFLLKKGSTLMIPGPVQYTSRAVYGEDANQFRHKRFMRTEGKCPNAAGFRGFGGGSTLCPGQHFVSTEIIVFVALTILRFDIEPVSGSWTRPSTVNVGLQATVPPPDDDLDVIFRLRNNGPIGTRWNAILKGSDKALQLVAEDVAKH